MAYQAIDGSLTADQLRAVLDYDPETGVFTWKARTPGDKKKNSWAERWAGSYRKPDGYLLIRINYQLFRGHRLAFLWMTGKWPEFEGDHIDGNPSNNRWSNLRDATSSQNKMNKRQRSDNTSGYKGVWRDKRRQRWVAEIMLDKKKHHLGYFDTAEAAHAAYCEAAKRLHGDFARNE